MLAELHVSQLGVIEDVSITLGAGMTVLTGETGAGKTLIVDAISLLLGARADPVLVRPEAAEAVVEGRFVRSDDAVETIVARVVPATGRARAYVDGRMANAQLLVDAGARLVDLHGQHAHQSLLLPAAQRAALDLAGSIDTGEVTAARQRLRTVTAALQGLGGDDRTRARELELLRYQLAELDEASIGSATEDDDLRAEEEILSDATALRQAAAEVAEAISGDDGMVDRLGRAVALLASRRPLQGLHDRLLGLQTELADAASDARGAAESIQDDPERLGEVSVRRHLLTELRRKYGDTLTEVIEFREANRARVLELEDHDRRAAALDRDRTAAQAALAAAEERLRAARVMAAPAFAKEVEKGLRRLAMPRARFEVEVGPDPAGEQVTWLLAANPGEPSRPLAKVASGGELARTMLAVRLVLSRRAGDRMGRARAGRGAGGMGASGAGGVGASGAGGADGRAGTDEGGDAFLDGNDPPTLVFDEVDAGIGGEAAVAIGQALADLGRDHQVLVVTHLPQVAACASRHLVVDKASAGNRTTATVRVVDGPERVVELSRMLSGRPDSATARRHAEELLAHTRAK
jgi:DNA repair protein RecN (Recombination protein N)